MSTVRHLGEPRSSPVRAPVGWADEATPGATQIPSKQLALLLQVLPKVGESPTAAPPLPTITIADTTTRLRCQLTRPAALRRAHIESPHRPPPGKDHARGRPCRRTLRTASNERPGPLPTTDRFQPHFARLAGRLAALAAGADTHERWLAGDADSRTHSSPWNGEATITPGQPAGMRPRTSDGCREMGCAPTCRRS